MVGTSKLMNIETREAQMEKEAQKQVGKYIFDSPALVITQGEKNFSTGGIETIEDLAFFINTHANMKMLEDKGFDRNFLNEIKSDINIRHDKYSKDKRNNDSSRFSESLKAKNRSRIEERNKEFEKEIRFTPSQEQKERVDSGDTGPQKDIAGSGVAVPKRNESNVIEQDKLLAEKFLQGTAKWINDNGGNYEAVLAARKYLEDKDLLGKSLPYDLRFSSEWTEKDLVIASLLNANSKGKLYLLEENINGPGGYHAQITYEGNEEKAALAYAAWKKERIGATVAQPTPTTEDKVAEEQATKRGQEEREQAEIQDQTPKQEQEEGERAAEGQVIEETEKKTFFNSDAELKDFSEFVEKLETDNYNEAAFIFMAHTLSEGDAVRKGEFLSELKNDPGAVKHARALAAAYEAKTLDQFAEITENVPEPEAIVAQDTGNIKWGDFKDENIDTVLKMTDKEIRENAKNIVNIPMEKFDILIERDKKENDGKIMKILREEIPG